MSKPKKDVKSKLDEQVVNEATDQIQILTEALQRERADSSNLRRRYEEQIGSLKSLVKAEVVKDLLPVIDNFERSLKHIPSDLKDNDYVSGINAIVKQFEATLEKLGVEKIRTIGEIFDPELHEAVSMEDGKGSHEIVSEEAQSGYKLGDHVLRHAMVKVKMGNPKDSHQDNLSNEGEE